MLRDAGITLVGFVPDGGLRELIERLGADPAIGTVALTTEEEGIAMCVGAHLGGGRGAVLMQSSGVGNCINMVGMLGTCQVPALLLVTMRGQTGEANPWQVPMGQAAGETLEALGVDVRRASTSDAVPAEVARACEDAFGGGSNASGGGIAVLIDQAVIGVKSFDTGQGGPPHPGSAP